MSNISALKFDSFILLVMQGPRVMVVGPTDSGKGSLCSMLLNWACKRSWKPTFVDLDVGQGLITIPGCIAATSVKLPLDPVRRIPVESPLVYFYGHTTPSTNIELYKVLLKELAQTVELHFLENAESRAAGMVINTMGWVDGVGYELILHAIDTFNANGINGKKAAFNVAHGIERIEEKTEEEEGEEEEEEGKVKMGR